MIATVVLFYGVSAKDNAAKTGQPAPKETAKASSKADAAEDTLVVIARLTEIPGKFASNDLYNYVYIMKYRIVKVVKGAYASNEILVGHYNPLIPRSQIKDRMKPFVAGNVTKFSINDKHMLVLIKPIDRIWKDAVEDEYPDSESDKYIALKADIAK
jgi:hypothetical protein